MITPEQYTAYEQAIVKSIALDRGLHVAIGLGEVTFTYQGSVPESIKCVILAYDENGYEHSRVSSGNTLLEALTNTLKELGFNLTVR